jgi:hypothetical protein
VGADPGDAGNARIRDRCGNQRVVGDLIDRLLLCGGDDRVDDLPRLGDG